MTSNGMDDQQKNFLEKLRSGNDAAKQRWLVLGTIVVMGFVMVFWLKYFNSLVTPTVALPPAPEGVGGFSLWETLQSGLATVSHTLVNGLKGFHEILKTPRSYLIAPPQ